MKQTIGYLLFIALLPGMVQPTQAAELMLHWRFDSPYEFGAIEPDASGRSVDGISTWARIRAGGGMRYAPDQGVFGGAGLLGGVEPGALHGVRGSMQSLESMKLGREWTVSLWVKPCRDVYRYYDIVSFVQKKNDKWASLFSLGQHGRLRAGFYHDGKERLHQFFGKETRLPAGKWSHLLFVCGRKEMSFYLNGKKAAQAATTQWDPKAEFFVRLSGRTGGPHNRLYGLYDDLRIYNGALGADLAGKLANAKSDFYKNEKLPPVADAGLGYTAWLQGHQAEIKMQGGLLLAGRNGGATTYKWEIAKQPKGARGKFADPNDPATSFTTDKTGAYEFKLTANNAGGSDSALAQAAVFAVDKGPDRPKLFTRKPEDILLLNHVEPPHPKRAAALKGKKLPLIAHWTFDDIKGDTVKGSGPKASDITFDSGLAKPVQGKYGRALKIDVNSKTAKVKLLDFGQFDELIDEFTLSFWVYHDKTPGVGGNRGRLFRCQGDQGKEYWRLYYRSLDQATGKSTLIFRWWRGAGKARVAGNWTHYAVAYSKLGHINKFFVNGEQASFIKQPLLNAAGKPRLVFTTSAILDDVALYNKVLNVDEVWALYNSPNGAAGVKDRIPVDPYMSRGYQSQIIAKYMPKPKFEYRNEGFAAERFGRKPSPPYTHPRLNLDPDDLPRIRKLTRNTRQGHSNFTFITLYPRTLFGENMEHYTPNVDFPELLKAPREADRDKLRSELEAKFKADPKQFTMKQLPRGDGGEKAAARGMLAYKALLTADQRLARILIDNMMKSADLQKRSLDVANARSSDWQHYYHDLMGRRLTPLMYDYLYGWMTQQERKTIRDVIARSTAGKWALGMYGVTALNAHTSNWEPWITGELMIASESIYGEDGFDAEVHAAAARALKLCSINTDDPDSGAHYEGMGKGTLGVTQISVLSRNEPDGQKSISSTSLYNHMTKFLLHIGLPWGNRRMMYDEKNGGLGRPKAHGILAMHYAYPNDPVINYLKHCIASGPQDYTKLGTRTFSQESWLIAAPYIQDWKGPADIQQHLKHAAKASEASLGYMSVFRGMMVARSSWDADAAQLYFSPRSIRGGHSQIDRGYFIYNALGRQWIPFRGAEDNTVPDFNAVVTVDTLGQDTTPGRVLSYQGADETKGAAFDIMGADLTGSYRQINGRWPTLNYSRLRGDSRRPWLAMPSGYLAAQLTGDRPLRTGILDVSTFDPEKYKGAQSFAYAYRSAAFARGRRPYGVIIDDIKKDDATRQYVWNAPLPKDIYTTKSYGLHGDRVILTDPADKTKHLLVKIFGDSSPGKFVVEPVVPIAESRHRKKGMRLWENLKYKSKTDGAKFRVLLYAYRDGDPMPKITGKSGDFTITIGKQTDSLRISTTEKRFVKLTMTRK